MLSVFAERDVAEAVIRHRPDRRIDAHIAQPLKKLCMEIADRQPILEREPAAPPIAATKLEPVRDEVEFDLEATGAPRNRVRSQSVRRHIQRYMPPVIDGRAKREADFPNDLEIEVQRVACLPPRIERQGRPVRV